MKNQYSSDIFDIIRHRRSVRKYNGQIPVKKEIEKILEAGRWAPSGMNNQPWRFLVVRDKRQKDGLSKFTQYGAIIRDAPVAIVVCMDIADSYNREKDLMAMGACIQNMLLMAHFLGLGTCWLGEISNKKEEVRQYLSLDKDLDVMAVVTLGLSDEGQVKSCRKALTSLVVAKRPRR